MKAVRVTVTGRVQGVGYRAFVEDQARARNITGWVRNRQDGSVEAVFSGAENEVDALIAVCDEGPRSAIVFEVVTAPYDGPTMTRFMVRPTE